MGHPRLLSLQLTSPPTVLQRLANTPMHRLAQLTPAPCMVEMDRLN